LFLVDLDTIRDELNVSDESLVRVLDVTQRDVSALNGDLLCLVLLFIGHLGNLDFASSGNDSVFRGSKIPDDNLSIHTSTDNDVLFVRMELYASNFYWGFQNVIIVDDVGVPEVHNKYVSKATLARVFASLVEV
jgi:hypothetical protein